MTGEMATSERVACGREPSAAGWITIDVVDEVAVMEGITWLTGGEDEVECAAAPAAAAAKAVLGMELFLLASLRSSSLLI